MLVTGPSRPFLGLCIRFWSIKVNEGGCTIHTPLWNQRKEGILMYTVVQVAKISQNWPKTTKNHKNAHSGPMWAMIPPDFAISDPRFGIYGLKYII